MKREGREGEDIVGACLGVDAVQVVIDIHVQFNRGHLVGHHILPFQTIENLLYSRHSSKCHGFNHKQEKVTAFWQLYFK